MLALKIVYGVSAAGGLVLGFIILMELLEIYPNMKRVMTLVLTIFVITVVQLIMVIILKNVELIVLLSVLIIWLIDLLFLHKVIQKTITKGLKWLLAFLRMLYHKALSIRKKIANKEA